MQDVDSAFLSYNGPGWTSKYLRNTGISKSAKIIDVAAGTGLAVVNLRQAGFTGRIDAVDGCQAMLDKAKERGLYTELICCKLGDGSVMPVGDSKCTLNHLLESDIYKDLVIYEKYLELC